MTDKRSEPAFPVADFWKYHGLTKRELFAAMAMHGIIAGRYANPDKSMVIHAEMDEMAYEANLLADALLAELDKSPNAK